MWIVQLALRRPFTFIVASTSITDRPIVNPFNSLADGQRFEILSVPR